MTIDHFSQEANVIKCTHADSYLTDDVFNLGPVALWLCRGCEARVEAEILKRLFKMGVVMAFKDDPEFKEAILKGVFGNEKSDSNDNHKSAN